MSENNFKLKVQAVLDKVKSVANIKADIKAIESKLPKLKIQGTLNTTSTRKELNSKLKSIKPKVKVDADTTQAEKKIKKIGKQKTNVTITPTVDTAQVVSGLKKAQKETKTLWERFVSGAIGANLVRMSVQKVTQAIHEAVRAVKELDTIKTNIQMVSGTTNSEVNSMMQSYNAMAKELSSTTKEVGEAANEFLRMGESIETTNELIRSSQVLSKTGMIESADAASYLISSLKGYQIAAKDSMDVVSKLVETDTAAAVSAGGLAEAISRCASIANNSGTTMDRLIGYAAAIGEVTQESMSVVGNSMKTFYSRFSNLKINRFIDDESGESLSDVETVLNKLGIQLRENETTYRNFDDVLDDIAKRWGTLTQVERNAVSIAMAGNLQRNRFLVLMDNFSNALEYSEVAANSAGSALERYGVYEDSIEAKTNELTAAIESLSTNVVSEELYSGIIQATTGLVEFLDKTNLLKGTLAGLVAMGVSKAIVSIGTGFITAAKSTAQLSAAMALLKGERSADNLMDIGLACKGLSNNQLKLILSTKGLRTEQRLTILEGMGLEEQERKQMLTTLGFAEAENVATASTLSFKSAWNSLRAAFASNPIGFIITGIATAVSIATMAFSLFKQKQEEAAQALQDAISEYESAKSSLESINSELDEQNKKIDELLAKDKLTYAEKGQLEELQAITKELLLQQDIEEKRADKASKDVADKAIDAYNKQYGRYDKSEDGLNERLLYEGFPLPESTDDIVGMIAAYIRAQELLEQSQKEFDNAIKNGEDTTWLAEDVQYNIDAVDDYRQALDENISDLQEKRLALEDEYNKAIEKRESGVEPLTSFDKDVIETYESIYDAMKMVYEYTDQNAWNNMEITNIFNTEGIEKTKDELTAMAKAGELTPETINSYKNLNEAVQNSELFLNDGQTAAQAFCDEIYGCIEAADELVEGYSKSPTLSISSTIDQLNTQLKPAFDSLKSAYQDIFTTDENGKPLFTLENVDISMLDSIKSKLDELNKLEGANINIDYSSFENLARVLTDTSSSADDVQAAFNLFATSVLNGTDVMENMDESTMQLVTSMLESMGVANAEEVVMHELALAKEEARIATLDLANMSDEAMISLFGEAQSAGITQAEIYKLAAAEIAYNSVGLSVEDKIAKLGALAGAYGDTATAALAAAAADRVANGHGDFETIMSDMMAQIGRAASSYQVDFSNVGGGKKSASKAGKEAADAYLEAFEKELKDLDDLKDRGKITEKQYLDALRRLYVKYFNQKKKYLKEFEKYEHQYLDGMKSLYESAFSYITKQIDKRIDAINDEKDAAISALEARRDAELAEIEAKKEQHENEIEGIEKEISAKEKEIKAMQDANKERERSLDLQKAEYDLQRMQNQRTVNVYKDGQMVHEADTSGIRDAKQEVEDAKLEIDISKIEKEIDLLEEEKDKLQELIDALDKEAEKINKHYDDLIAKEEQRYDAMIKGMENYKSQFEELTELFENAQMETTLSELNINMDALLSGSQEEFEKLKTAYIGILADMSRGNDEVIGQLSRLAGVNAESVSYLESTKGAFENLGAVTLEGLGNSVDGVADSTSALTASAGDASTAMGGVQGSIDGTSKSIAPLNDELEKLNKLITTLTALLNGIEFPEIGDEGYVQKLKDIALAFGEIAVKCAEFKNIDFASIIGTGSTVTAGNGDPLSGGNVSDTQGQAGTGFMGLASAISEAVETISGQMDNLQFALQVGNDAFEDQINKIQEEYLPAWEELQTRLAEIIGVGGGDGDGKGDGKQKSGGKDGGSESGENGNSIIGIMQTGGDEVAARLEDPWLKAFNDFATDGDNSIQSICDKIIEMVKGMADTIQEQCAAAANALNALAETASSFALSDGSISIGSITPHATGTVGKAFAKGTGGYKGLLHDEKNAVRSEYGQPELTVYPDGKAEITTEPTLGALPKGTVIFNEEQTEQIMKNKGEVVRTYENGNVMLSDGSIVRPNGDVLRPLPQSDPTYQIIKQFKEYFAANKDAFIKPAYAMNNAAEAMKTVIETINNNSAYHQTQNNTYNVSLPNVTNESTAVQLMRELRELPRETYQYINRR